MARIAIVDYRIVATNPIGGGHLRLLRELSREHQFTVFVVNSGSTAPAGTERGAHVA